MGCAWRAARDDILSPGAGKGRRTRLESLVFSILGMHRSGTSCLAGTLEEAGVSMGAAPGPSLANARGNREDEEILRLHKDLLHSSGGTWHSPPRRVAWTPTFEARRDRIVAERSSLARWGFKDPRTLLVLDGWLAALPRMRLAGVFRSPIAVARSLAARDGFSIRKGIRLWTLYNERLLEHAVSRRFPVISFDLPLGPFEEALTRLVAGLGLEPPARGWSFFEPALRHEEGSGEGALPRRTREVLAGLEEIALRGPARG